MSVNATLAEFRRRFPLGSVTRVILIDDAQRYAGIVVTASAYGHGIADDGGVRSLAVNQDVVLTPEMNIEQVMQTFDTTETEDLPVVDQQGQVRHSLAEHAGAIAALAWRPKSAEIAAAGNGGVRIHRERIGACGIGARCQKIGRRVGAEPARHCHPRRSSRHARPERDRLRNLHARSDRRDHQLECGRAALQGL